ncbi:MurR/RpiR family transcriptional regulator [Arthrobacter russicus]|uniref:DNA-binding MurR/RpiR family transcriptional regulator n=1 Tax=Arthrobacter russicus TaxID=172040 RepID=A0ABU1J7F5_9MICC|nr:MurR/RpiR family transcriptional regulator [Arthrobacter russicus]MDR6268335.1 DNA-binding MurR/RpiR family transcriptional regulator [Arthrobacter russicus]
MAEPGRSAETDQPIGPASEQGKVGHAPGKVLATIRSLLPSLLPAEQAVASVLLERAAQVVELSSQQVAELSGASRATVVRTCQSLGFTGYQQLRVLVARDAGYPGTEVAAGTPAGSRGSGPGQAQVAGAAAIVAASFAQVRSAVDAMTALLHGPDVERAVQVLRSANRVVVSGNGLSAALAMDTAARLSAIGRPAEFQADAIGQQITARLLGSADALLLISGSGANSASFKVAQAARNAGAEVIVVTAFARSPLTSLGTVNLIVGMPDLSFQDEVTVTTRIPQTILAEGLIAALTAELGPVAARAKAAGLEVIGDNLAE